MAQPFPPYEPDGLDDAARGPRLREIPIRLLIPNFITVLAICAGMTGIRLAVEGRFEPAVMMVLLAAFLDGIDGRAARLLKAQTRFGVQMDSLADIISFGVAPALVLYVFLLDQAGPFGWIAALVYAIAAGLRLARFNVAAENPVKARWQASYFVGVPAPAGALTVLLPVYLGFLGLEPGRTVALIASLYTIFIGFLLVSRLPVFSGKGVGAKVRRDYVMPLILLTVVYISLVMSFTWATLALTAIAYLAALPFGARAWKRKYGAGACVEEKAGDAEAEEPATQNAADIDGEEPDRKT